MFDLDHTLISVNSSYLFCQYLYRQKVLSFSSLLYSALCNIRHRFFKMPLLDLHKKIFQKILLGRPLSSLEVHVDSFIQESISKSLYMPAVACLLLAQHLGHYTVILSNSPSFLVEAMARFFNVNEWRATQYGVDKDQRLCNISSIMEGEMKAESVQAISTKFGIEKGDITAYSDSYLDLSFLLSAGCPIAVNPDRKLRALSMEKQWQII